MQYRGRGSQKEKRERKDLQQGQGGGGSNQQYSDDFKKGWAQAMEDYKNGKLKI